MRIAIRAQLAALVIVAVLICLIVVSIPTWNFVYNFVVGVKTAGLSLTASLKAARISSEINLLYIICQSVASRILLQQAFLDFYNGNATDPFKTAREDISSAMANSRVSGLLQARLYSRNTTGAANKGLVNVTAPGLGDQPVNIALPYLTPDGKRANLSDTEYGYPPSLYPNITYQDLGTPNPVEPSTADFNAYAFPGMKMSDNGGLLLGPMIVNETYALMSLTIPVRSNEMQNFVLGYLTLIVSATSLIQVQTSREGLGKTGMVLIVGPSHPSNQFPGTAPSNGTRSPEKQALGDVRAHFVLPPVTPINQPDRHGNRDFHGGDYEADFRLNQYPTVLNVYYNNQTALNNASATLSTRNEENVPVAVGIARPQSSLVQWAVVVENDRSEAYEPISTLRKILLACSFGTAGLILILVIPCAHLGVKPILRLKAATEKSIVPPGYEGEVTELKDGGSPVSGAAATTSSAKGGILASVRPIFRRNKRPPNQAEIDAPRLEFRIPGRVEDRKHWVTDELTELTKTYNSMTDELVKQYTLLDEKVAQRTRELEISKKAAEAANESKTLFIANISHELKTPLNGIIGTCSACMDDNDFAYVKHSLKTILRSGDLLLHLLNDLLSFSKNQISHQVTLERRVFRLGDIKSQITAIFDKQVREKRVNFSIDFLHSSNVLGAAETRQQGVDEGIFALGPSGMGRLKDVYIWGDQHRIMQVIINLVNNSLKFTPSDGKVQLRIRCLGEAEQTNSDDASRNSSLSRIPSGVPAGRNRQRRTSGSIHSKSSAVAAVVEQGTALEINPMEPKATKSITQCDQPAPPPPAHLLKLYMFEFEVEDSGHGIPEHMQTKIFEPFVQGDSSLSRKFGGTGLGLSICAQLVKLMSGSITLKSVPGKGSVFTMQIPLHHVKDHAPSTASSSIRSDAGSLHSAVDETQHTSLTSVTGGNGTSGGGTSELGHSFGGGSGSGSGGNMGNVNNSTASHHEVESKSRLVGLSAPHSASNPSQSEAEHRASVGDSGNANSSKKLKVLVADDNATNIEIVSRMLKLEDVCDVTVAKDGREAIESVRASMNHQSPQQQFDLILMDVQMPHVNGLESTRLIREMGFSAPIVALTAFSDESNIQECLASGMDAFLSKPIRRPALKKVLTKFSTIEEEEDAAVSGDVVSGSAAKSKSTIGKEAE